MLVALWLCASGSLCAQAFTTVFSFDGGTGIGRTPAFLSLQPSSGTAQVSGTMDPPKESTKLLSKFPAPGMNLPVCVVRRRTAREKCLEESLRQCIRPFRGELLLLAMMRYAACLSLETPRPCKGPFGKQVSGTPF